MLLQLMLFPANFGTIPVGFVSFVDLLLKVFFMLGAVVYLIFAFVVVRQVQIMKATVITPFSGVIQLLTFVHLLLAFGVVVLFFVIL